MRRRDAGLSLIEMVITITILGIVAVVFMGVSKVSFGKDTETMGVLNDTVMRTGLQSKLLTDVGQATTMGLTNAPCAPARGTQVLWTRTATDSATGLSVVDVYYVLGQPDGSTLLLRTECRLHDADGLTVAPDGDQVARWTGNTAVVVRCNGREPGNGCGGTAALAADLPADATSLQSFDGIPTTDPMPPPNYGYPPIDPVHLGEELATITGGWGTATLTLSRPNPTDHPAGTPVRYAPVLVDLCVPLGGADCTAQDPSALHVLASRKLP
jgi:prepilin-type N-terminal cleavage/methylation domain-containing protein